MNKLFLLYNINVGRYFKIILIICLFILLYGIYYFAVPAFLNSNFQKIEQYANKVTGINLSLSNPHIKTGLLPSVEFSADGVSVLNDDKTKAIDLKNFSIDIKLFPLIFKNLDIIKLSLDSAELNFVYDVDGKFKIGQYTLDSLPKSSFGINPKYVEVKSYNINFDNKISSKQVSFNAKTYSSENGEILTDISINKDVKLFSNINAVNNAIIINDLKVVGKNINITASGEISKLNSQIPDIDMNVKVVDSRAEDILAIIPDIPNLSPDMDIILTKQAGFWGNAQGEMKIKGKADFPDVYGYVKITDAYMVHPIPNSKKAVINLKFNGDTMDLDVIVPAGSETVWVKGPIKLDKDRTADLHITSTENVDLKTAQIVLNPLHKIFNFELGPVPIMDIRGKGSIDLRVKGTRKDPYAWGEFKFKNAVVSFLDIHNMEIHNGSGSLKFDNQNTEFESKTAVLNKEPVSIKGTCTLLGDLDFDVETKRQDIGKLLKIIKTSPMLKDIQKIIEPIESASGLSNVKIKLTGKVKDVSNIVFNKNLFASGTVDLITGMVKIKDIPFIKLAGIINFKNLDVDFNLNSDMNASKVNIVGSMKNDLANLKISSHKFNLADAVKSMNIKTPYMSSLSTINTSFDGKYIGKTDKIEYDKLNLKGKIYSNKGAKSQIIVNNSDFELANSNFKLSLLEGSFDGSPYKIFVNASKIFSKNRNINGYAKINNLDLNFLDELHEFLPKEVNDIEIVNGKVDFTARARNNNLNVYIEPKYFSLIYKPINAPISLKSGTILLQNNTLNLNKLNAEMGKMPIFVNGKVYNIFKNPDLNIYLNAKPDQEFFEQTYNKQSIYPIKLKGDAILTSKINGTLNNLNAKSTFDIKEDSSIYYMGATIGDKENPVKIYLDGVFYPTKFKINKLQYDKIIMSQNNKPFINTQLNASGTLTLLNDNNLSFGNFRIKTKNPTDAKIFNIIFRKPFMKQGVFTSDIILNGTSINPKILGKLDVTSIDIPFLNSTIHDINIDFKPDKINFSTKGKVLTNAINLEAVMQNKLSAPYIVNNLNLKLVDLDINTITDAINDIEAEAARTLSIPQSSQEFDLSQVIIKNARLEADKIKVRNINADNFSSDFKFVDKKVDVNNFKFDIAEGSVIGDFKHDVINHNTSMSLKLNQANAAMMSEALFDLKGQVYGLLNGEFNLSCVGDNSEACFKTLSGNGTFKIADGRMPKLGSLEYLLKAGNLFKSGFTGLSINSLIDIVTPLKTGNFDSISGNVHIKDGIADNINIYSSGNDLNMYMTGNYDIVTSIADMKIFGSLSKNITTVFGKIKNASLNTLFNTIPGVNDSTEKLLLQENISKIPNIKDVTNIYRIFTVDVNGDINGTDYVKSFRWVK